MVDVALYECITSYFDMELVFINTQKTKPWCHQNELMRIKGITSQMIPHVGMKMPYLQNINKARRGELWRHASHATYRVHGIALLPRRRRRQDQTFRRQLQAILTRVVKERRYNIVHTIILHIIQRVTSTQNREMKILWVVTN